MVVEILEVLEVDQKTVKLVEQVMIPQQLPLKVVVGVPHRKTTMVEVEAALELREDLDLLVVVLEEMV